MGDLLFNPNGRIGRNRFLQGMVVLTVASLVVAAAAWLVDPMFGALNWVVIFPYICVYGKRLHDAGHSAWWVIAIWFCTFLLQVILLFMAMFMIFPALMTEEQGQIWDRIFEYSEKGNTKEAVRGFELLLAGMEGLIQRTMMAVLVIVNFLSALVVGQFKTMPQENQYGSTSL